MEIQPDTTLVVISENLNDETSPFASPAGEAYRTIMADAGVNLDRVVFGWVEDIAQIKDTHIKFVVLAGDGALHKFRKDLDSKECHGRAMMSTEDILIFPTYHPEAFKRNPIWAPTLRDEILLLKRIASDRDNWASHTPDTCVKCRGEFFRVDEQGVVYCEDHWGAPTNTGRVLTPTQFAKVFE